MTIKVEGYIGSWCYASVATDAEAVPKIVNCGHNVLSIPEKTLRIVPENICFTLLDSGDMLDSFCNFDVVEISDVGICRPVYKATSNDNAIVVTSQCNSNCIMCPSPESWRKNRLTTSIEKLCELINYIPSDSPHITITGGEPTLLGDDFFKLMEKLNQHFPQTRILYLTNARAFSHRAYAHCFNTISTKNSRIAVPIHASNSKLHDYITQTQGSFDQTTTALLNLSVSKSEIEVRVVVSKLNVNDLDKVADFLVDKIPRITCVNFIALEMSGSAASNRDEVWLDYRSAFQGIKNSIPKLMGKKIDVNLYNFPLCALERGYWGIARDSITDYKIRYTAECDYCRVREICGGQFSSTFGGNYFQVKPVECS